MHSFVDRLLHPPHFRVVSVVLIGLLLSSPAFSDEIHDAAAKDDLAKVQALLKDNPDLALGKDSNGETPLHLAAFNGHRDVAEVLLANNANVDAKDNHGNTPLHWAAANGHKDVAELLLANNAAVNAKGNGGATPLHAAVFKGYKDVVQLLLASKADVNAKADDGTTPLLSAVMGHKEDVVELLLANNAEVNARNNNGATPLYIAAYHGYEDLAERLLASGADVNAIADVEITFDAKKDTRVLQGTWTPLRAAELMRHKDVAKLLRQHGGHE